MLRSRVSGIFNTLGNDKQGSGGLFGRSASQGSLHGGGKVAQAATESEAPAPTPFNAGRVSKGSGAVKKIFRAAGGVLVFWVVMASILMAFVAHQYMFVVVDEVREWYVFLGCAARVKAQAATFFSAVFNAHDAVSFSIRTKLYFEPMDYAVVERILAPIFVAAEAIHTVDIAFSDRPTAILVRRNGPNDILVQSDADDCYLVGVLGCSIREVPAKESVWYTQGKALNDGESAGRQNPFLWYGPEFVPVEGGGGAEGISNALRWAPSYSLVFSSVFPGTRGAIVAVGKVTLEISKISAILDDPQLGEGSQVYLIDNVGAIVSARKPGEQVFLEPSSGRVRFRRIWELDTPWAEPLREAFLEDSSAERKLVLGDGTLVIVSPFEGESTNNFRVVIVAQRTQFANGTLSAVCIASFVACSLPYVIAVSVMIVMLIRERAIQRREARRANAIEEAQMALYQVGEAVTAVQSHAHY